MCEVHQRVTQLTTVSPRGIICPHVFGADYILIPIYKSHQPLKKMFPP